MHDDGFEQAMEEGRYWFCLNDVVDYMEMNGQEKVFADLSDLFKQRQTFNKKYKTKIDLEDIPF